MGKNRIWHFEFDQKVLNTVIAGLGELQLKVSVEALRLIESQLQKQMSAQNEQEKEKEAPTEGTDNGK